MLRNCLVVRLPVLSVMGGLELLDRLCLVYFRLEGPPEFMVVCGDIEFYSEITSRDSFDVVLHECVLALFLDVVYICNHEEGNEDSQTAEYQTMVLSVGNL